MTLSMSVTPFVAKSNTYYSKFFHQHQVSQIHQSQYLELGELCMKKNCYAINIIQILPLLSPVVESKVKVLDNVTPCNPM